jgi:hypothetical protein
LDLAQVVTAKMAKIVAALFLLAIYRYARTVTALRTVVANTHVHPNRSAAQLALPAKTACANHLLVHLLVHPHQRPALLEKISVPPPQGVDGASPPTTTAIVSRVTCPVRFPAHTTVTMGGTQEDSGPHHQCASPLSLTMTFDATSNVNTAMALRHLLFLINKHATRTTVRTLLPMVLHSPIVRKFWSL